MDYQLDDQMMEISEFYKEVYTQPAPQQGPAKPKRKRRKNKGGSSDGVLRKRKLSEEQVRLLEMNFGNEHKLESERKDRLALELGLDARQVAVWFQNRRARWKSQKIEEEYSKLKSEHENTMVEKCRLESEVLKLKEQLSDAEKEIQKLFERSDGVSSNSPGSSFSMEAMGPLFLGDFGMEGIGNIFYEPAPQPMDWVDLYM